MKITRVALKNTLDKLSSTTKNKMFEMIFNKKDAEEEMLDLLTIVGKGLGLDVTVPARLEADVKYVKANAPATRKKFLSCVRSKEQLPQGTGVFQIQQTGGARFSSFGIMMMMGFLMVLLLAYVSYTEQLKMYGVEHVYLKNVHVCSQKYITISAPVHTYDEWSIGTVLSNLGTLTRSVVDTAYSSFRASGSHPDNAQYRALYDQCVTVAGIQKGIDEKMYKYERDRYASMATAIAGAMLSAFTLRNAGEQNPVRKAAITLVKDLVSTKLGLAEGTMNIALGFISNAFEEPTTAPVQSVQKPAPKAPQAPQRQGSASPAQQGADLLPPAASRSPSRERSRSPSRRRTTASPQQQPQQ